MILERFYYKEEYLNSELLPYKRLKFGEASYKKVTPVKRLKYVRKLINQFKPIVIYGKFMYLSRAELKDLIKTFDVKTYKRCRSAGELCLKN